MRVVRVIVLIGLAGVNLAAQQTTQKANLVPSDALNKALPKWLRFSGEYRGRVEGFTAGGFRKGNSDSYFLNRFRINMKIQPADWLKFTFQGQDARVFGKNQSPAAPPFQDTMDLRLAFVELGDAEKGAVGLRAGRQELAFGEERLVGNVHWINTARSFDAVRATFRHNGYRLDAFASSVVVARDGEFNRPVTGNNLHGLYGALERLIPKATVEPYVFWRLAPRLATEKGTLGNLDFKTIGFRWVGKLPGNFDYGTEIAGQTGSLGTDTVAAWAGHWLLGHTIASWHFKPRFFLEYNVASGDRDPHDGKRGTFDQLYPTGHDKYGLADQVGWRNIHHARVGVDWKPQPKWSLAGKYNSWWLFSARDALYNAAGTAIARVADGSAGRHVGQEVDFQGAYSVSKQMQIAGGYAYLSPGTFLKKATPGRASSFPYVTLSYLF